MLLLVAIAVLAFPQTAPSPIATSAPTSQSACYTGPIHARVLNPDGTPAPNIPLGVFGMTWHRTAANQPPKRSAKSLTDVQGEVRRENERECCFPTFFYATDEARNLAGITLVDSAADLAKLHTVRLQPARRVRVAISSPQLEKSGDSAAYFGGMLSPILDRSKRDRYLRYVSEVGGDLDFLVPPGEYRLDVRADRCQPLNDIVVRVDPGDGEIRLPPIELSLSPLARLTAQAAPPLHVATWSDGRPHSLADYRGKPHVLCFGHAQSDPRAEIPELFTRFRAAAAANFAFIAVHPPTANGFEFLAEAFRSWELKVDDPGWSPDPRGWPFPNAVDERRTDFGGREFAFGRSLQPYGDYVALPLFILIDAAGRVVANSQDSKPNFDVEFRRLADPATQGSGR